MNSDSKKLTRKGSKHAQPELRVQQIITAAMVCFSENDYASTTIDAIAKQAGLSKGSVYRFFSSKDELLLSVIDHIQSEFNHRYEKQSVGKTCLEKLEIYCRTSIEDFTEEQELISMWFQILNLSFAQAKLKAIFEDDLVIVTKIIEQGIEKGEFVETAIHSVPITLISIINGHFLLSYMFEQKPEECLEKFEHSWNLIKPQLIKH